MPRWSFHLQIYFLSHRFKSQKEITEWPDSCIQDRSIYEDVEIFARTLYETKNMSEMDYENYHLLFETMIDSDGVGYTGGRLEYLAHLIHDLACSL